MQSSRLLKGAISLSQLNPNDLFSVVFLQKSDEDSEDLGYSISIKKWTEDKMAMKVDFEKPLGVSRGLQPDQFYLRIKDTRLFVSKETGESILPENLQILSNIPTQVPNNINATQLIQDAERTIQGSMNTWIVIQLGAQKLLKGNMDDLLSLFFTLQIQCYMMRYQYMQPASADMYMEQYTSLIEFKALNPQSLIRLWDPQFDMKSFLIGAKEQVQLSKD